ncbi:patatin-like phospholipase family protein [Pacificibacter marinus]|uniref:patatin-like phospholipase family protein n=1 Tax=Pacificibacter marinus TaxID=658057 RepID=UPI001C06B445|nr:patatin-like phospholipase family protein [Pacificibacter marinus]MBU2868196.1 patatin-like phospholipase family protein [Pacificibacter marinus]
MTSLMPRRKVLLGLAASTLSACANTSTLLKPAPTPSEADPFAKFRMDANAGADEWAYHLNPSQNITNRTMLAISAGGEDGAFGAGALTGWSATGQRPEFDLVTGISSGALIAPFAFLGSNYDDEITRIFTTHDGSDIMQLRPMQAVFNGSLYDTAPLAALIAHFMPDRFLDQVAARHASGGRLFVMTSELDSARAFVWNMGAIAQARQYDLFRLIIRASTALPGLFSPVKLRYSSNGVTYKETHIDGGVHMQFLAIPSFALTSSDPKFSGGRLFVLINNTLNPAPVTTSSSALAVSQQALSTMIRASALASVQTTQLFSSKNNIDLFITSVDPAAGIVYDPSERFASAYMNALYEHGYERAIDMELWTFH